MNNYVQQQQQPPSELQHHLPLPVELYIVGVGVKPRISSFG